MLSVDSAPHQPGQEHAAKNLLAEEEQEMSADTWNGHRLNLNDTITYWKAETGAQNPHAPAQRRGICPYTGVIVAFTDSKIGVRADGFRDTVPLYYVAPEDIISVKIWREEIW